MNESLATNSWSRSILNVSEGQVRREYNRVNEKKSHKRFQTQYTTIMEEKDFKKAI